MPSKWISIFLPDGNPNGVKIIELSNRTIQGFVIPRAKITDIKDRSELNQPALYVLCDREGTQAYVGECENFFHRIKSHEQGKDFWEVAIAFIAKDNGLEKGDVKFLESIAVEKAKQANRMEVMNLTVPTRNNLHEFKAETILEFFDELKLLISSLGYPLFDEVSVGEKNESDFWFCKSRLTNAKAVYDENGFTVLKGSIIDGTDQPSFIKFYPYAVDERHQILDKSASTKDNGKTYALHENVTFTSANKAGGFALGANINAWTTWKNKNGQTMDAALRQK